jgi:hypothetical protein
MNKKTTSTNNKSRKTASTGKGKQRFPPGWNEEKVREVIAHYDRLTDEERAAEIERAAEASGATLMAVPTALVPAVLKLIQRHEKSA